jgi:hypothetical protein
MDASSIDTVEETILLLVSVVLVITALSRAVWLHFGR